MAKTYAQLQQQIEALTTRAEAIRHREKAGVVTRIRDAIAIYGLTAEELGFGDEAAHFKPRPVSSGSKSGAKPGPKSGGATPKYRDETGNIWGGRGPRPGWLRAALAAGRSLESFTTGKGKGRDADPPASVPGAPSKFGQAPKKASAKFKSVAKYRDEAGNQWSGRGPKPRWLTAAIEEGKTLAQLTA